MASCPPPPPVPALVSPPVSQPLHSIVQECSPAHCIDIWCLFFLLPSRLLCKCLKITTHTLSCPHYCSSIGLYFLGKILRAGVPSLSTLGMRLCVLCGKMDLKFAARLLVFITFWWDKLEILWQIKKINNANSTASLVGIALWWGQCGAIHPQEKWQNKKK